MIKLFNDTFNINETIDSNSTEVLLENEFTLADDAPDMEKIISTEGKVKINDSLVTSNTLTLDGKLIYNIIYRSNNDDHPIHSITGQIPFREEIGSEGLTEDMEAFSNPFIDYIEADQLTERTYLIKAVIILDTDVYMKRPVTYVASLESDGSVQAISRNIAYTDKAAQISEEININDAVELSKGSGEIYSIIKSGADVYIENIDMLNDKMLVEGICRVSFMFMEDNDLRSTGYISEEFPFTHYIELPDISDRMYRDISISLNNMTYSIGENFDNEKKLIEFALPFTLHAQFYDNVERNIIMDCYSTDYQLDLEAEKINLSSLKNLTKKVIKYDNSFDLLSGTIKDVYSVDVSPKISEKRILDKSYVIDGYLDVNMLYLNGDINKIDKAYASLPFTADFPLTDDEALCTIYSDIKVNKCNAYRKGSASVNLACDIDVSLKFNNHEEITVIKNIAEGDPLDRSKMPSLIFRVVQPGESLWDIAKNYNLSINNLKELNDIPEDNALAPGSKIIIARSL